MRLFVPASLSKARLDHWTLDADVTSLVADPAVITRTQVQVVVQVRIEHSGLPDTRGTFKIFDSVLPSHGKDKAPDRTKRTGAVKISTGRK